MALIFRLIVALWSIGAVQGFALVSLQMTKSNHHLTSLHASKKNDASAAATGAASLATTAFLLANVVALMTPLPANALHDETGAYAAASTSSSSSSTNILLAGRSGGRSGGRAYRPAPSRMSSPMPSTTYRSTTIIRPMIAPPPIVVSPFGGGFGYGYGYSSPLSGFGLGYGLGAMNSAGDSVRDYRQESEIQQSKAELEVAKQKEAELEARIKQLEQATQQQQLQKQ